MACSYFCWGIFSGNLTKLCRSRDQTAVCLKTGIPGGCDSVSVGISNISSRRCDGDTPTLQPMPSPTIVPQLGLAIRALFQGKTWHRGGMRPLRFPMTFGRLQQAHDTGPSCKPRGPPPIVEDPLFHPNGAALATWL